MTEHTTDTDILHALESNSDLAMLVLEPPIAFNAIFADMTGSVTAALLLSVCTQGTDLPMDAHGWTELDTARFKRITRLTAHEQRTARRVLCAQQLIEERRIGFPARSEYRVNFERVSQRLISIAQQRSAQTALQLDGMQPSMTH